MSRERPERPSVRELFLAAERKIEVSFHTSNVEKFLQARAVFERFGLRVGHFRGHTEPYAERYVLGKQRLLEEALSEVMRTVGERNVFFVEDTSVRIEALSSESEDYPGLAVKEWFGDSSFEDVDEELKQRGNDRRASVRSDVALHLPGLSRAVYFWGETKGSVAESAPDFVTQIQHPWLTARTFNGWFVPSGTDRRLGEMSFEESWYHDFRIRAFVALIDRLEEYFACLNLPPQTYTRSERKENTGQLTLVPDWRWVFVVIGATCAGKTTFGEFSSMNHGCQWIEASSVVRAFWERSAGGDESIPMKRYAEKLLAESGYDIVARRILQLVSARGDTPLVITGFRALEEIEQVKAQLPDATVVVLDASERTRYERHIRRARASDAMTLDEFREMDDEQGNFGLLDVASDVADIRIENEGSLEDYHSQIAAVLTGRRIEEVAGVSNRAGSARLTERSQLYRCLAVLDEVGRAMDCREIQESTAKSGTPVRFNNVNKILKQYPILANRLEARGERVRYRIADAGRTYLRLVTPRIVGQAGKDK